MPKGSFRNWITTAIKLLFSFGLIAWMILTGKLPLGELRSLLDPQIIAFAILSIGAALILSAERWRLLLQSQGFQADRSPTYKMTLVGIFFSFFLPGGVGGDFVKAFYVVKNIGERKAQAVGTVVFDRLIGLFTMTLMALATSLIEYEILLQHPALKSFALILGLIFTAFLLLFWLIWSRKTQNLRLKVIDASAGLAFVSKTLSRLNEFQLRKGPFIRIVALSLASQSFNLLFFITTARFLGETDIPLSVFLFCVPMGFMATAIPISPGGIGVGQAAFLFLFNLVLARETQVGAVLITAFQMTTLFYGLIGAYFYVFAKMGSGPGKDALPAQLIEDESKIL